MTYNKFNILGYCGLLVLFILLFPNYRIECAEGMPVIETSVVETNIKLRSGSKAVFTINVVMPEDHHAYLNEGDEGY